MSNPLKTHTDNLADGDFLLSASLTNMLEGVHGNGILLLEDTHTGSSIRNTPASLSGAVSKVDAETIRIKGGLAVLDGLVVILQMHPQRLMSCLTFLHIFQQH